MKDDSWKLELVQNVILDLASHTKVDEIDTMEHLKVYKKPNNKPNLEDFKRTSRFFTRQVDRDQMSEMSDINLSDINLDTDNEEENNIHF
jgi:hypothetical protein